MRIQINVNVAEHEIGLATELLSVLTCAALITIWNTEAYHSVIHLYA